MKYVFGPVPSRRLGMSLGVDIVPFKTCTLDCIYCQIGITTKKTIDRDDFVPKDEVLAEIRKVEKENVDFITFSGSGEPTLNSKLGEMIRGVKDFTDTPIAVITNGSLLYRDDVRKDLSEADLVVPSLDAITDSTLDKINRHHRGLTAKMLIDGLKDFTQQFKGKIWLEILIVKGVNDDIEELKKMADMVHDLRLDKIQLNTVDRPPAEEFAHPITADEMQNIAKLFDNRVEIIADFDKIMKRKTHDEESAEERILALLRRRPCTADDISTSLGFHINEVMKHLSHLLKSESVKQVRRGDKWYYEPTTR